MSSITNKLTEPEYTCAVCKKEAEYMEFNTESSIVDLGKRVNVCSKRCFLTYKYFLKATNTFFSDMRAGIMHK